MTMEVPKIIVATDADDYQYENSSNPTLQHIFIELNKNNNQVLNCLAQQLWQPSTAKVINQIVYSPNMGANLVAIATTQSGTTNLIEPTWPGEGSTVTDGSVTWLMIQQSPGIAATDAEVTALVV